MPSSKQPSRKEQQSYAQDSEVSIQKAAASITVEKVTTEFVVPNEAKTRHVEEDTMPSVPTSHAISPEIAPLATSVTDETSLRKQESRDVEHLTTPAIAPASDVASAVTGTTLLAVETQIQHDQATMSLSESKDLVSAQDEEIVKTPSGDTDAIQQETKPTDDYSIPVKDDDVIPEVPTSPKTTMGTSAKSVFSPSAVTFAALPTRDLQRGRSIGASKHARMTSHLVESVVPEVQAAVKTPGPATTVALPRPSENKATVSKAARDSKSGGTGAGSSWISRKVLAGSGGEDLRKSLAASKRPSTMDHAMGEESDKEADELDDYPKRLVARASEAPAPAQRFSIASKTPQAPPQSRQTLGASTMTRPVEPPQTNLSKMIADLQERRAVATFSASVTRATLPSLQLGRGAQGIAAMGISSGLLGRAALQASLDRSRTADSQTPQADTFDVFDENPYGTPKLSAPKSIPANAAGVQGEPSTTEELNQAVDEILRKISTERQMQQVPDVAPVTINTNNADPEPASTLPTVELTDGKSIVSPTLLMPRISKTRADEEEVEELTKRTNAMSVVSRESVSRGTAPPVIDIQGSTTARASQAFQTGGYALEEPPASTTPVNSPPRVLYRASQGQPKPIQLSEVPPKPMRTESIVPVKQKYETTASAVKPVYVDKPLPPKTQEQQGSVTASRLATTQRGLSQSQAVSIDSDESEESTGESVFEDALGDKRFDEEEVLADEVAKLAMPLRLDSGEKSFKSAVHSGKSSKNAVDSESDTSSVEEVESNGTTSRAPVSLTSYFHERHH